MSEIGRSPPPFLRSRGTIAVKRYYVNSAIRLLYNRRPKLGIPSPTLPDYFDDCTVIGTNGSDYLEGTSGDDVICGLDGSDTIDGKDGNDIIYGGNENDQIDGGPGSDIRFHDPQGPAEVF